MPSTKLTFVIYSMSSGGAERVTANLANYWAARGWPITILTISASNQDFYDLHQKIERIALDLAEESSNKLMGLWMNLRRVFAMRQALKKAKPDIVIGMMTTANIMISLATLGIPAIKTIGAEHIHPPQLPLDPLWDRLRYYYYRRLTAVTALTQESATWLKTHTLAKHLVVIPNPTLWPLPEKTPLLHPESICLPERRILLAVGRLNKQKGFDLLLDAYAPLASLYQEWDLVILGEGNERPALQAQVQAAGLTPRVFLPGLAGNIGKWYGYADLYVMSSRFEGFPNTLTEAMAHGLPAISFDCDTGPRDIIRHELDGLLVPPGNVTELTAALDRLMGDADLRNRFAVSAVEARERFSLQRITKMWEKLFDDDFSA